MKKRSRQIFEKTLIAITNQLLIESGEPYKREITLDVSLNRHLGFDSLGRAELFRRIEKEFEITLPDRLLAETETLHDIVNYLDTADLNIKKTIQPHADISHKKQKSLDLSSVKTLLDILYLYGEKSPEKPHIYFQNEEGQEEVITYGQLFSSSLKLAQGLKERGLMEGETVAIMQPTHPEFFYTFFGTLLAGGIPVPIYPPFRAHLVEAYAKTEARILRNAEVRMLVT